MFNELRDYDIVTAVDPQFEFGNTNFENKFPYPGPRVSSDWAEFPERCGCFMIFYTEQPVIKALFYHAMLAFVDEYKKAVLGRTVSCNVVGVHLYFKSFER